MGMKVIGNKISQSSVVTVLPVSKGGTGGNTRDNAANTLQYIPEDHMGMPMGVASLDSNRIIYDDQVPDSVKSNILIDGPLTVHPSTNNTYTIVGYNSFTNYVISVSAGSIIRNNDVLTFIAPATTQMVTIQVNGVNFVVDVVPVSVYIATPSITSPLAGANNISANLGVSASPFSVSGGSDTHQSSDWQIATDANFTNIIVGSINDTTNKTSWLATGLNSNTNYYLRVRYSGVTMGYSNWSPVVSFSTKVTYLPTTEEAILAASDKTSNDQFGYSVSISSDGSRVTVGAYVANPGGIADAGKAYIFSRSGTTWTQEAILTASDKTANDNFGCSVSISSDGSRVAVGAPYADPGGITDAGKTYIFSRSGTTWTQEAILTASDKTANGYFGYSVSIFSDGTRVAVGAYKADLGGISQAGKAYIFSRSGTSWTQEAILTASDKTAYDRFGYSVSISSDGTRAAVGAYAASPGGITAAGKVYIFSRSGTTWTQEAILAASDKAISDYFGWSISISSDGSRVAVSASYADPGGITEAGKVYIFSRSGTTWTQEAILTASDKASGDYFGYSVSISSDGSRVAVGAIGVDSGGISQAGKAYIFSRSGTTWTQEAILTASDKASGDYFGCSVSISSDGSRVTVGAYVANPGGTTGAGKVYIFS